MVAIALVTAALIVVLSVFNGFEDLVKSLYGDFYADVKITAASGKWIPGGGDIATQLSGIGGIVRSEPVVEERAILIDQEDKSIVWLKGVQPGYKGVSGVARHIIRGDFETGNRNQPAIVLGSGVENALQITAGKSLFPITVYLPNRNAQSLTDPLEALVSANAVAAGTFAIQQDFDNQYAYTNKDFMQYMLDLREDEVSSIELFTAPEADIASVKRQVTNRLGNNFVIRDRFEQNQNLYAAMQMERVIIYAVSFLILVIAAFNIISSLTMTVLEKQEDIAVLQAMGAPGHKVSTIFLKLGAILAGLGGLAGFVLGLLICIGQQQFHWVTLGGQSFLIDHYPVAMRWPDFVTVALIILIIAFFSGWLPSRKAARTDYSLKS